MTIHDDIVYSVEFSTTAAPDRISRFDMNSGSFLPYAVAPARSLDGLKVYEDQLYFCNYFKTAVGVLPLSALKPED
jgi:hypothetical protein